MKKYRLSDETRLYHFQNTEGKASVTLRQIIAERDFSDVTAGTKGGWLEDESALSHDGNCWVYDENSVVFGQAQICDNARITQPCVISHAANIRDNSWVDGSQVSHGAQLSDNVTVQSSVVRGICHLYGNARILHESTVIAATGMTPDREQVLKIYDNATVSQSRIVHQAQIYGDAMVNFAFIEHRAEVFENALIEGNEVNNVWICDCAKVYGNARLVAGLEDDAIPTLRYSSQVAENAVVEGNVIIKHHVLIGGQAWLRGGPIMIDDKVVIQGRARISGDVLIEHRIEITDDAVIEAFGRDNIHLRGEKVINGQQRITRTPLLGAL
ncbi:YdcK family protein [Lelliottia wanjuensis]|uniref:YdcK family protein n=1 Tax=Lelliottia wanjuensis TaxID=3050585 RepID=A0AAP4D0B1_9ENTR|nr:MULTISPECIES: YdcK family protein [unclassified Lelliottia]MDK9361784.1 YdcK family protein [Lelliottia sp. V106_12]MDK9618605.1 YdcK family protein [Lelliottia sp. V106_9]